MSRMKKLLALAVVLSAVIAVTIIAQKPHQQTFSVVEASIPDMQADNLLNVTNYMSIGSIVGSDTFGKPISAFPRRSIRFWMRF